MPKLSIYGGAKPDISLLDDCEALAVFLLPAGSPEMQARVGRETKSGAPRYTAGGIIRLDGQTYRTREGAALRTQRSTRYGVLNDSDPYGPFLAVLQVMTRGSFGSALSNIYTAPAERGRGHATRLLQAALRDFPGLTLSPDLSRNGARFFGYLEKQQ